MKMMKKFCSILAVAVLILSMASVAAAVSVNETNLDSMTKNMTHDAEVTLALSQSFEITLPGAFSFTPHGDYLSGCSGFAVNIHRLNSTAVLYINVTGTNTTAGNWFNLTNSDGTSKIQYVVGLGNNEDDHIQDSELTLDHCIKSDGSIYNTVSSNYDADGNNNYFNGYIHVRTILKESDLSVTGEYTDRLTFKVQIVE